MCEAFCWFVATPHLVFHAIPGLCGYCACSFSKSFPGFEGSTGWKMTSTYDPMPAHLQQALSELYRPFNEELFTLLKTRYEWK